MEVQYFEINEISEIFYTTEIIFFEPENEEIHKIYRMIIQYGLMVGEPNFYLFCQSMSSEHKENHLKHNLLEIP